MCLTADRITQKDANELFIVYRGGMCNLQQTIRNVDGDPDYDADTGLLNGNFCHCDIVTNCTILQ